MPRRPPRTGPELRADLADSRRLAAARLVEAVDLVEAIDTAVDCLTTGQPLPEDAREHLDPDICAAVDCACQRQATAS